MAIKEYSYGIVPLCKLEGNWKVLLIQHSHAKYWGFPKGHAEVGETPKEAATRELFEETNLKVVRFFSQSSQEEHYQYTLHGQLIDKTVLFFTAEVGGDLQLQEEEVSKALWLNQEEALKKLTYPLDKSVCSNAFELIQRTSKINFNAELAKKSKEAQA